MTDYSIRQLTPDELEEALAFVWAVFDQCEASEHSEEGVSEFWNRIDPEYAAVRMGEGVLRFWGAFDEQELLAGVCCFRGLSHVELIYIRPDCQRQKLASRLLKRAIFDGKRHDDELPAITVDAPQYSAGFFAALGFEECGDGYEDCGIRYFPMSLRAKGGAV
ncbi:MAG: GNAT family N-acetyltransferase [Clostridia bacterium]|nr:GNAT family N-acetyltransferase [Clostridia bacterium]